ncbi:HAD family hydrolase [Nocardia bovistercoris]|uniref:HAD family hydrolase n=1 Tax=Nocardia bovistercoris TaxID=2785916 RepID=A0A931IDN4_9NOCA|nr:HAD family hydrolase [Nocardia bovistercoris]MBH0778603.1 HAD family hydrolase [Nocardia bovistercoris]
MIYSRNAFSTTAEVPTVCVEHLEGAPLSFMTTAAALRMQSLTEPAAVVPTTTRTIKQFNRIQLPGAPWRYAITSNGGNILVDGVPDMRWRIDIDARVRAGGATLSEVSAELRARVDDSWASKFRIADHLFCYLVVKPKAVPEAFLAEWDGWCRERGWSASQQGRKIYTMPDAVCKSVAVAEVRRRLLDTGELAEDAKTLAAGDGALDAEMLRAADSAIRPRHGELELLNWTNPNLTVTRATGILAGEEIIDWFIEAAPAA